MEETNKHYIKRNQKKKATVNETLRTTKLQINQVHHKRSNSERAKKVQNNLLLKSDRVINLITKGPSINKLFFKNDNISIKSSSMPKANKKSVKKFRSINIDKGKNEIYNNIMIKKNYDNNMQNSHINLNYYNMDCVEKMHNLKGVTKDFLNNNMKKSKKPNYINKNYISNDKLITFNNNIKNKNPIYEFYQPLKEKEMLKKPLQKIQSVNQEKRKYKFSDFKVIKDIQNSKEEDDDDEESYGNINPDDYREGNNIEFIGGSSFSEEKDESSSLSSIDKDNNNNNKKKEKKKKKSDKLSNLVNKSIKKNNTLERCPSQNNFNANSNNNSENEDNYFINDTKFFMSPKINSKHPSNKSLKSDAKSDYFNSVLAYFNESNNDTLNKNSFIGGSINKNKIRKNESLATNSNVDYEGDIEDEYDLVENGNQDSHFIDQNKFVNNLTINDSYTHVKSPDNTHNKINNQINSDNVITNIHIINNINNESSDNTNNMINNNNNYYLNNNIQNNNYDNKQNMINNITNFTNVNSINNNRNINNINSINNKIINNNFNNDIIDANNNTEFQLRNYVGNQNQNQSNIINIHNMNNFNNNNFIFGNGHSGINNNNLNNPVNNPMNKILNNNINLPQKNNINLPQNSNINISQHNNLNLPQNSNINIPQHNIMNDQSYLLNKNNINYYQGNNNINEPNYNVNNYIISKNNPIGSYQLNQLNSNNLLIDDNNNQFINYDINTNPNKFIINNSNFFQPNINNINNSINNNLNNRTNHFYNQNNLYNLKQGGDNMNYLNYYNAQNSIHNDINNNINNLFLGNNHFTYNSQRKKQKTNNNYINPNILNQNMINPNFINQLQFNNYLNQNNNMNLNINNHMNLYNNLNAMNNLIMPNNNLNININPNVNINNHSNNNMTNSMGNLNHFILNNNNINNNSNKPSNYSTNKHKKQNLNLLSNEELAKQAYNLAKYQNGCRYLQKRIENNQKLVPTLFFPNILGHIQELSNDQFGNYYIKIIIKYLPEEMIYKLIQLIHPSIPKIGTNQYGTKVLQYLIDFLTNDKNIRFFIEKTLPHVVILINDLNGIHIIQRLICIKSNYVQLIYNKIFENIKLIAVTRDGSNFIKKLLDFLDEKNLTLLINSINDNLAVIITNQYGNYIIQNIIMKDNLNLKYNIIETIIKNIVSFSNQKFSSNVVEKCFEVYEMKDKVIDEILKNNNFEQILLNEYGNYVIQKALIKSDQNKQHSMFKLLVPLIHKLQCLSFGQKLLSKLFILYPRLSIYILNSGEQM